MRLARLGQARSLRRASRLAHAGLALLLTLYTLGSCTKESERAPEATHSVQLDVQLSAEVDDALLKALSLGGEGGLRYLDVVYTKDPSGANKTRFVSTSGLNSSRIYFRKIGTPGFVAYADISWTLKPKPDGSFSLKFSGPLTIMGLPTGVTLEPGNTWYVAATLDRPSASSSDPSELTYYPQTTFTHDAHGPGTFWQGIPVVSDWTKLEVVYDAAKGTNVGGCDLLFKPKGTLIAWTLTNKSKYAQLDAQLSGKASDFTTSGKFNRVPRFYIHSRAFKRLKLDFSPAANSEAKLLAGGEVSTALLASPTSGVEIPAAYSSFQITAIEPGDARTWLLWSAFDPTSSTTFAMAQGGSVYYAATGQGEATFAKKGAASNEYTLPAGRLQSGKVYHIDYELTGRPAIPLEWLADEDAIYGVQATGRPAHLWSATKPLYDYHASPIWNWYTGTAPMGPGPYPGFANPFPVAIGMEQAESNFYASGPAQWGLTFTTTGSTLVRWDTARETEDMKAVGDGKTIYALGNPPHRAKQNHLGQYEYIPGGNDNYQAAYRYEYQSDGSVKITGRYLGSAWQGDITTISNPAWWTSEPSENIVRYAYPNSAPRAFGTTGGAYLVRAFGQGSRAIHVTGGIYQNGYGYQGSYMEFSDVGLYGKNYDFFIAGMFPPFMPLVGVPEELYSYAVRPTKTVLP